MVKGRNEPCTIANVAFAVAGIKGVPVEEVVKWAWRNSMGMFGLGVDVGEEGKGGGVEDGRGSEA